MSRPKKDRDHGAFLTALASGLSVTGAAAASKVDVRTLYRDREQDEDFKTAWDMAIEQGTDALEDEALRRAKDGTARPVFHNGKKVGTVQEHSDTLMIFLLKARRPDKFKDRAQVDGNLFGSLADELAAARKRTAK